VCPAVGVGVRRVVGGQRSGMKWIGSGDPSPSVLF
jgi:hypothetical protein